MKVRYCRPVTSDEDVESGHEKFDEPSEELPTLAPNGTLQEPDEKMISVIHTSQIKVEPVVDSDYENTLEGFEKMTGLTVGDVEKNEDEGKTKHKASKHKHHHRHHKSNDALADEDGKTAVNKVFFLISLLFLTLSKGYCSCFCVSYKSLISPMEHLFILKTLLL